MKPTSTKKEEKTMKAYYYENNGYNGILLVQGERFISIDEVIDGIDIVRENIPQIVSNFVESSFNDDDFNTMFDQQIGTMVYGENASEALEEQDYFEEIYSA